MGKAKKADKKAAKSKSAKATKVEAKATATVVKEDKQEKVVEVMLDSRINNKEVVSYVDALPDTYDNPKQNKKEPYAAWVIVSSQFMQQGKTQFTEDEFLDALAKLSKKSRDAIVTINKRGKAASYPDGHVHRGLYSLACVAQGTMKTKSGKGNTMGAVKHCLVRCSSNGKGNVSKDGVGHYEAHPKVGKNAFPAFEKSAIDAAVSFLTYND